MNFLRIIFVNQFKLSGFASLLGFFHYALFLGFLAPSGNCWTAITRSMVLKFFSHLKHRARFVAGCVAVWNSWQTGQRKRKTPSLIFEGICNSSLISRLTGIAFLNSNNSWDENRFFMDSLSVFMGLTTVFFLWQWVCQLLFPSTIHWGRMPVYCLLNTHSD